MSKKRDAKLNEFTSEELVRELTRRTKQANRGLCTYCGEPNGSEPCKFPKRHVGGFFTVYLIKASQLDSPVAR